MFGSFAIGKVRGIPIRIHVLFVVLIAFLALTPGVGAVQLAGLGLLAVCVVLHELGHSLVAQRFGIRVLDITLWPLGGLARLSHVPESSRAEALIALAGPVVNFALAAIALPAWIALTAELGTEHALARIALYLMVINALMGAFNLIPAFPMDGGRVLRAILATSRSWLAATRGAVLVGRICAVLLFAAGVWMQHWILCLLAVWLWWVGAQELAQVEARHAAAARMPEPAGGYTSEELARLERFRGPLNQFDPK